MRTSHPKSDQDKSEKANPGNDNLKIDGIGQSSPKLFNSHLVAVRKQRAHKTISKAPYLVKEFQT